MLEHYFFLTPKTIMFSPGKAKLRFEYMKLQMSAHTLKYVKEGPWHGLLRRNEFNVRGGFTGQSV